MLTLAISLTEEDVFVALTTFLGDILPGNIEIVRGQDNRVPEPKGPDFVVITPILRQRLATNIVSTSDGFLTGDAQTRTDMQKTQLTIQLDVHGPNSADMAQIVSTWFRSEIASAHFEASGVDVVPLYESDPRQIPYLNGEQQIENRWVVDLVLQANIAIDTTQEFADTLAVSGIINVDAAYPPT